jgi:hypothetical protein
VGGLAEAAGMSVNEAMVAAKKMSRVRVFIVNLFLDCQDTGRCPSAYRGPSTE